MPLAVLWEGRTLAWDAWLWVGPDGLDMKVLNMAIGKHMWTDLQQKRQQSVRLSVLDPTLDLTAVTLLDPVAVLAAHNGEYTHMRADVSTIYPDVPDVLRGGAQHELILHTVYLHFAVAATDGDEFCLVAVVV